MSRSNRGAARVSAIWIIVVGVVALATTVFAFISQGDLATANKKVAAADAAKQTAVDAFETLNTRRQDVVTVLGHYDATSADPVADLDAAREAISGASATYADISATATSYQALLPAMKAAYNAQANTIATLKADVERLNAELSGKADALAAVTADKEGKIQDLTTQLADAAQNADQQQQSQQATIDETRQTVADNDQILRDAQSEFSTKEAGYVAAAELQAGRIGSQNHELSIRVHEDNLRTDGAILEVASSQGLAWINRGSDNRLTVGTRFDVLGQQNGTEVLKAIGYVNEITSGSMARISMRTIDSTDPVVAGDRIVNPFFDPTRERHAILIGEFAGKAELIAGLGRMNIVVDESFTLETRLAIIGGPQRVDPETGDALDEELQPQDTAEYKQAVALNIQLMTVSMLREYFPQTL